MKTPAFLSKSGELASSQGSTSSPWNQFWRRKKKRLLVLN